MQGPLCPAKVGVASDHYCLVWGSRELPWRGMWIQTSSWQTFPQAFPPEGTRNAVSPRSPESVICTFGLELSQQELRRVLFVCTFVSEQTLTWNGPPSGAGLKAVPCVHACMPSGLTWRTRGSFHAPLSLEVVVGFRCPFLPNHMVRRRTSPRLKRTGRGNQEAVKAFARMLVSVSRREARTARFLRVFGFFFED